MPIINKLIQIETGQGINIHNITPQIKDFITSTPIKNGQVVVFSRHTTTALTINENEVRLLEDVKIFLQSMLKTNRLILKLIGKELRKEQ